MTIAGKITKTPFRAKFRKRILWNNKSYLLVTKVIDKIVIGGDEVTKKDLVYGFRCKKKL